jgi:excisionase family DNA binding protein
MQVPPNSQLRIGDVVRLTGLSASAVRKLIDDGVLPSVRTEGGHRLVLASSVEEYLAQRAEVA